MTITISLTTINDLLAAYAAADIDALNHELGVLAMLTDNDDWCDAHWNEEDRITTPTAIAQQMAARQRSRTNLADQLFHEATRTMTHEDCELAFIAREMTA